MLNEKSKMHNYMSTCLASYKPKLEQAKRLLHLGFKFPTHFTFKIFSKNKTLVSEFLTKQLGTEFRTIYWDNLAKGEGTGYVRVIDADAKAYNLEQELDHV